MRAFSVFRQKSVKSFVSNKLLHYKWTCHPSEISQRFQPTDCLLCPNCANWQMEEFSHMTAGTLCQMHAKYVCWNVLKLVVPLPRSPAPNLPICSIQSLSISTAICLFNHTVLHTISAFRRSFCWLQCCWLLVVISACIIRAKTFTLFAFAMYDSQRYYCFRYTSVAHSGKGYAIK